MKICIAFIISFIIYLFKTGWWVFGNPKLAFWIISNNKSDREASVPPTSLMQRVLDNIWPYDKNMYYSYWIKKNEKVLHGEVVEVIDVVDFKSESVSKPEIVTEKDWILIKDGNCDLSDECLKWLNLFLSKTESSGIWYADYDYRVKGKRNNPQFLKPWDQVLYQHYDYLGPVTIIPRSMVTKISIEEVENFRQLKKQLIDIAIEGGIEIGHIARIIGHLNMDNAEKVETINPTIIDDGIGERQKVSIVIPTANSQKYLPNLLRSIKEKTVDVDYEVLIVLNGGKKEMPENLAWSEMSNISILHYPCEFNFSAINNFAVSKASGDVLCFLNDDMQVVSENWLNNLLYLVGNVGIGAVGAKLLYEDKHIQHLGVVLGIKGVAGHKYRRMEDDSSNPEHVCAHKVASVTGACMCIRKNLFNEIGGFNEDFAVSFNDLDLCLRLKEAGYENVVQPQSVLYHFESKSRGSDFSRKNKPRYLKELNLITEKWEGMLANDPYTNENFSKLSEEMRIKL